MFVLLCRYDSISLFHSLYPFLNSKHSQKFQFTTSADFCLSSSISSTQTLIIVRFFKGKYKSHDENMDLMKKLRDKFSKIIFFDDSDGADSLHPEFLPYVDEYWKKQLLRDLTNYLKPMYGEQLYSEYYHKKFNVHDDEVRIRPKVDDHDLLQKIKVCWNLGVGSYPIRHRRFRQGLTLARLFGPRAARIVMRGLHASDQSPKEDKVHAHFSIPQEKSLGFQRRLILEKIVNDPRVSTGLISDRKYKDSFARTKVVISPFGYGEICFRDFEAIQNRCLLVKPAVEHLVTWPEIYIENETYVSCKWDGSDIQEKIDSCFESEIPLSEITEEATRRYKIAFDQIDIRLSELLNI